MTRRRRSKRERRPTVSLSKPGLRSWPKRRRRPARRKNLSRPVAACSRSTGQRLPPKKSTRTAGICSAASRKTSDDRRRRGHAYGPQVSLRRRAPVSSGRRFYRSVRRGAATDRRFSHQPSRNRLFHRKKPPAGEHLCRVHVIAAHMGRQQTPATTRTHLLNRFQNGVATDLVQMIGSLIHTLPLGCRARRIHFQDRGSGHIVLVVDGAGFAAVQVASVADEGDRVNHLTYSYARILLIGRCFHESLTSASRTHNKLGCFVVDTAKRRAVWYEVDGRGLKLSQLHPICMDPR